MENVWEHQECREQPTRYAGKLDKVTHPNLLSFLLERPGFSP